MRWARRVDRPEQPLSVRYQRGPLWTQQNIFTGESRKLAQARLTARQRPTGQERLRCRVRLRSDFRFTLRQCRPSAIRCSSRPDRRHVGRLGRRHLRPPVVWAFVKSSHLSSECSPTSRDDVDASLVMSYFAAIGELSENQVDMGDAEP